MPMPIEVTPTAIEAVKVVKTGRFADDRGFFSESYSRDPWAAAGLGMTFIQDNLSNSRRGVVRGLHYQVNPAAMGKLVRCLRGAIFDVAVDIRRGSPTFGQYVSQELSEENGLALWVPAGFAHGFVALADESLVLYKCDAQHAPAQERAISYQCPKIGIAWPITPSIVSPKDAVAPGLEEADFNFVYGEGC